jgi:hypothetical protein
LSSLRTQIGDNLAAQILAAIPTLNYCKSGERPKIIAGDFNEYELPAVQIIGGADSNTHEKSRGRKMWNILVEVVIGPIAATDYLPTQRDLWDLMELIEQAIMSQPRLGIASVIHVHLLGSEPDLALLTPLFSGRIEIAVEYYQSLVGPC